MITDFELTTYELDVIELGERVAAEFDYYWVFGSGQTHYRINEADKGYTHYLD